MDPCKKCFGGVENCTFMFISGCKTVKYLFSGDEGLKIRLREAYEMMFFDIFIAALPMDIIVHFI